MEQLNSGFPPQLLLGDRAGNAWEYRTAREHILALHPRPTFFFKVFKIYLFMTERERERPALPYDPLPPQPGCSVSSLHHLSAL